MRLPQLPKIGLRTLKTALAVFLCLLLIPNEPFFACMTAVICLQQTLPHSVQVGVNRALGTIFGGLIGLFFLAICRFINFHYSFAFGKRPLIDLMVALGIIMVIYIFNLLKRPTAIPIACIVFLAITTVNAYKAPFYYALNRTFETLLGIFIALLVNKFIVPPQEEDNF